MNGENYHIEVTNALGEVLFNDDMSGNSIIHTDHFASGVYFIKISNEKEAEFRKFIKN